MTSKAIYEHKKDGEFDDVFVRFFVDKDKKKATMSIHLDRTNEHDTKINSMDMGSIEQALITLAEGVNKGLVTLK